MIIDPTIAERAIELRRAENDLKEALHEPSGKLSAGSLGKPLQWQILKYLGIPRKAIDDYALGLFERGNDVEDSALKCIPGVVEKQKTVYYRDTIGIIDALVDTKGFHYECGIIPHEIKSVKGSKYKRILAQNEPDEQYSLQACQNALAIGAKHFAIVLIASDDLRITTYVQETEKFAEEVDKIIDRFQAQLAKKTIPVFEARYKWQENEQYSDYPEWQTLTEEQIVDKMKSEYPEIYKKFVLATI